MADGHTPGSDGCWADREPTKKLEAGIAIGRKSGQAPRILSNAPSPKKRSTPRVSDERQTVVAISCRVVLRHLGALR